jgi:hypothetical protein
MVVERKDIWYMDDGGLTYTICEDDSPLASAPLVEPCCACDEAKYEVIFEGLWSRHTHPKVRCKKNGTNIPRKGIWRSQSHFPHSCVCERIVYSHDMSAYSAGGNMWTILGLYKSLTDK